MSDLNLIRLLLADPLLTQSDVELFDHQALQNVESELTTDVSSCPAEAHTALFNPHIPNSFDSVSSHDPNSGMNCSACQT